MRIASLLLLASTALAIPMSARAAGTVARAEFAVPGSDEVGPAYVEVDTRAPAQEHSFVALRASADAWTRMLTQALAAATQRPATQTSALQGEVSPSLPVRFLAFTSRFGLRVHPIFKELRYHDGVDIAARYGAPILATSDGVIGAAGWRGGYGLCVAVRHGTDLETRYGHLSRLIVAAGQPVLKGQVIGFVGSTGFSTGPHLHFEVRIDGRPVDPMPYLLSATPFGRS